MFLGCFNVLFVLITIIAKIYFPKKFNNIVFAMLLIFFLIPSVIHITVLHYLTTPVQLAASIIHKINNTMGAYILTMYPAIFISEIIIPPVITLGTIIYYVKTRNKTVLKKWGISIILLALIFYAELPVFIMPHNIYQRNIKDNIQNNKLAAKVAVIPGLKAYYARNTALCIQEEIINKFKTGKFPDFSSKEAQDMINEYIKYSKIEADLTMPSNYPLIAIACLEYGDFDNALKYADIAKKKGLHVEGILADIYIHTKDYEKAFEHAQKAKNSSYYLVKIYTAQNRFDKALEELEKENSKLPVIFSDKFKAFICYKTGKKDLALEYKARIPKFNDYSLEEFIRYMEIYDL